MLESACSPLLCLLIICLIFLAFIGAINSKLFKKSKVLQSKPVSHLMLLGSLVVFSSKVSLV